MLSFHFLGLLVPERFSLRRIRKSSHGRQEIVIANKGWALWNPKGSLLSALIFHLWNGNYTVIPQYPLGMGLGSSHRYQNAQMLKSPM